MFVPLVGVMVTGEFDRDPARLLDHLERPASGADVAERVRSARAGGGLQDVRALNQLDRPAGEAGVARAELAAVRRIVEDLAADRDRHEFAEVHRVGLRRCCR